MPIDSKEFRNALGQFATGICLISRPRKENDDTPTGIVVNSFSSLSLDPPCVLWCLDKSSSHFDPFIECEAFGVNILAESEQELSDGFANGTIMDFSGIETETWESGAELLPTSLVNLECTVIDRIESGDHFIIIGEVSRMRANGSGAPLLYHAGRYRLLREEE